MNGQNNYRVRKPKQMNFYIGCFQGMTIITEIVRLEKTKWWSYLNAKLYLVESLTRQINFFLAAETAVLSLSFSIINNLTEEYPKYYLYA